MKRIYSIFAMATVILFATVGIINAQPTTSWIKTVDGNGAEDWINDITQDNNGNT